MVNDGGKKKSSEEASRAQFFHAISLIGGLGATMICFIGVGFLVGHLIDRWLNTTPVFLLIFLFGGVLAGMIRVYQMVMKTLE